MIKFNYRARDGTLVIEKEALGETVRPTLGKAVRNIAKAMGIKISEKGAAVIDELLGTSVRLSDTELKKIIGAENMGKGFVAYRKNGVSFWAKKDKEMHFHCGQRMIQFIKDFIEIDFGISRRVYNREDNQINRCVCGQCGYVQSPQYNNNNHWHFDRDEEPYFND